MTHDVKLPAGSGCLGLAQAKHLMGASAVAILLAGCGLPAQPDVRAYDNCMSRHPQEVPLCEGPRAAYEVDTSIFEAKAASISAPAVGSYDRQSEGPPAPKPLPIRPHLAPVTSGPSG
jgi:hypothetical protein